MLSTLTATPGQALSVLPVLLPACRSECVCAQVSSSLSVRKPGVKPLEGSARASQKFLTCRRLGGDSLCSSPDGIRFVGLLMKAKRCEI